MGPPCITPLWLETEVTRCVLLAEIGMLYYFYDIVLYFIPLRKCPDSSESTP